MRLKQVIQLLALVALTAGPAMADDTSIYGTQPVTLEPNVLIVFDTSGSMTTEDVPAAPYDPATVYTGNYSTNAVYHWKKKTMESADGSCRQFTVPTCDGRTEGQRVRHS